MRFGSVARMDDSVILGAIRKQMSRSVMFRLHETLTVLLSKNGVQGRTDRYCMLDICHT